jgi:hypothetical protein
MWVRSLAPVLGLHVGTRLYDDINIGGQSSWFLEKEQQAGPTLEDERHTHLCERLKQSQSKDAPFKDGVVHGKTTSDFLYMLSRETV